MALAVAMSFVCLLAITLGIVGYLLERNDIIAVGVDSGVINAWQKRLQRQEQQIANTRQQAAAQLLVLNEAGG